MVDSTRGIGGAGLGGGLSGVRETFSRDTRASRDINAGTSGFAGATPNGPRGRRMLSPDTPVELLDHSAPRGTYLDILV
ncbi:conserved hypothetical protein [Candidatus Terasakiella magnetica]|nr:conserved hypothetical protein [Candidatus Terasakiella magnetica]